MSIKNFDIAEARKLARRKARNRKRDKIARASRKRNRK